MEVAAMIKVNKPKFSVIVLSVIVLSCVFAEFVMPHDPKLLDTMNYNLAPCWEYPFGTDFMGRDIFSMIWYGGRISLAVGCITTIIATAIAIIYGTISAMTSEYIDDLMMRFLEIVLSIPSILLIIFLQAIAGKASVFTISLVIGITNWMMMAKIVRTEVKQIKQCEFVLVSQCMGGGFWHVLRKHLIPNFFSSILFMVVMTVRTAIIYESMLSFLGLGFPIDVPTWGSMLFLSEKALMTNSWWIIIIPGTFIVITLVCITNIGNYYRAKYANNRII